MKKKISFGFSILVIALICFPSIVSAKQPPMAPEIELLINDTRITPETQVIIDQYVENAAKCGFKLNPVPLDWYTLIDRLVNVNYDMILFVFVTGGDIATFDNTISWLDFYCGPDNVFGYDNPVITEKIAELSDYYYIDNDIDAATAVFHEIEQILFEEQPAPMIGYTLTETSVQAHSLFINCAADSVLNDAPLRTALTYLFDKEVYKEGFAGMYDVTIASHLFAWSPYHDTSLPIIDYSLGTAKSTLAKAGYRPCPIKL